MSMNPCRYFSMSSGRDEGIRAVTHYRLDAVAVLGDVILREIVELLALGDPRPGAAVGAGELDRGDARHEARHCEP